MNLVIKITFMALLAAVPCLSSAFAQDPVPLQCSVSLSRIDFGTINVWGTIPDSININGQVACNRDPQFSYSMRVWISVGDHSLYAFERYLKRDNPSSDAYIQYNLFSENWEYIFSKESLYAGMQIRPECFKGGICTFKIICKLDYNLPPDFYAGLYGDNVVVTVRYVSEY